MGRIAALLALAFAFAGTAWADPRDRDNPSCPPLSTMQFADWTKMSFTLEVVDGRRILLADGGISIAGAAYLEKALKDNQPVDEVVIRSPGGSAEEGMKMGFVLRKWGIPTRIAPGFWCASACSFMFLGGPLRTIDPGGIYAVHMFTAVAPDKLRGPVNDARDPHGMQELMEKMAELEQNSAVIASEENDYMIRMGASRKLLTEIMYQQKSKDYGMSDPSTIRCLTPQELRAYNVVNLTGEAPASAQKPGSREQKPSVP